MVKEGMDSDSASSGRHVSSITIVDTFGCTLLQLLKVSIYILLQTIHSFLTTREHIIVIFWLCYSD